MKSIRIMLIGIGIMLLLIPMMFLSAATSGTGEASLTLIIVITAVGTYTSLYGFLSVDKDSVNDYERKKIKSVKLMLLGIAFTALFPILVIFDIGELFGEIAGGLFTVSAIVIFAVGAVSNKKNEQRKAQEILCESSADKTVDELNHDEQD